MLGCNHDITLWLRKRIAEVNGINKEIFVRHELPVKCRWKNYTHRDASGGMSIIYNNAVIVIPYFEGISEMQIKEGDIAALGIYDIEISADASASSPFTASGIKRLLAPNIITVKSVSRNFSDNMKGKHLRLTGI